MESPSGIDEVHVIPDTELSSAVRRPSVDELAKSFRAVIETRFENSSAASWGIAATPPTEKKTTQRLRNPTMQEIAAAYEGVDLIAVARDRLKSNLTATAFKAPRQAMYALPEGGLGALPEKRRGTKRKLLEPVELTSQQQIELRNRADILSRSNLSVPLVDLLKAAPDTQLYVRDTNPHDYDPTMEGTGAEHKDNYRLRLHGDSLQIRIGKTWRLIDLSTEDIGRFELEEESATIVRGHAAHMEGAHANRLGPISTVDEFVAGKIETPQRKFERKLMTVLHDCSVACGIESEMATLSQGEIPAQILDLRIEAAAAFKSSSFKFGASVFEGISGDEVKDMLTRMFAAHSISLARVSRILLENEESWQKSGGPYAMIFNCTESLIYILNKTLGLRHKAR